MNVLDLFSGIGGFSLGLERAGMRTVAFCEIDPYCRKVLAKHWPGVPCYDDVRSLTAERLRADGIAADVICGGFPCQDISRAGKLAGIGGSQSGLWEEYARVVRELRPKYVIVENVSDLLGRGIGRVLGDLESLGFDAEWHCIPASAVGFTHTRERVWIIAHCYGLRKLQQGWGFHHQRGRYRNRREALDQVLSCGGILRSDDGVPAGLDRIAAVGNAVVPQIPEIIGRAIMRAAECR
jgi:DNA (cytosine-5)-methyltransferase 1